MTLSMEMLASLPVKINRSDLSSNFIPVKTGIAALPGIARATWLS